MSDPILRTGVKFNFPDALMAYHDLVWDHGAALTDEKALLDYVASLETEVARLQARQITPEMIALYTRYRAVLAESERTGTGPYSTEEIDPLMGELWRLFIALIEGKTT